MVRTIWKKKFFKKKNVHFSDDDEDVNFEEKNEKNDFSMSDGTGTVNKTSSENERHVTYAGTDSMYDDPQKEYNRVVHQENDTRLHKPTYSTSTSNTVQKKYIPNNNIFYTYEGNNECQVQKHILPTNVPDCTFEVESCVDMSTLIKKFIGNSNQDSINNQDTNVKVHVENISFLQQKNQSIDNTDSDISKNKSCESVEIDSSEGH